MALNWASNANQCGRVKEGDAEVRAACDGLDDRLDVLEARMEIRGAFFGTPSDLAPMLQHIFLEAATLPALLVGSSVKAPIHGPTAETVLTISKITSAGVSSDIGTITYAETTGAPTIAFAAQVAFAAGDRLVITNQADNDASAADFSWAFLATRS